MLDSARKKKQASRQRLDWLRGFQFLMVPTFSWCSDAFLNRLNGFLERELAKPGGAGTARDEHGRRPAGGPTTERLVGAGRHQEALPGRGGRGIEAASVSGETRSIGRTPSRSCIRRQIHPASRTW